MFSGRNSGRRCTSRQFLRVERLDERIVPVVFLAENTSATSEARAENPTGISTDSAGFNDYADAEREFADGSAFAWLNGHNSKFASLQVHSSAAGATSTGQHFSSASTTGSLDLVISKEPGEPTDLQVAVDVRNTHSKSGTSTNEYAFQGQDEYADKFLATVGDRFGVTFSASASLPGEAFRFVEVEITHHQPYYIEDQTFRYSVEEGESLIPIQPSFSYLPYEEKHPSFLWDLNADGTWDSSNPTEITWATLQSLGMTEVGVSYPVRLRMEQQRPSGFDGVWADQFETTLVVTRGPKLKVTTPHDINPDESVFGPYLPGVNLPTVFTMKLENSDTAPKTMGYSLNGGMTWRPATISKTDPYFATFTYNPGNLKVGPKEILFRATGLFNKLPFEIVRTRATLDMTNVKPNFELKVSPQGNASAKVDGENARFIQNVDAPFDFDGRITNVPEYYHNKLQLKFDSLVRSIQATGLDTAKSEFTLNVGAFKSPGTKNVQISVGGLDFEAKFQDPAEYVQVIEQPKWLNGVWEFDSSASKYTMVEGQAPLLPAIKNPLRTPYAYLNKALAAKQSYNRLYPIVNVTAPIDTQQEVDVSGSQLRAIVVVLGKELVNQTWSSGNLQIVGRLDGSTLNPVGFGIRLKEPVVFGPTEFLNANLTIPLTPKTTNGILRVDLTLGLIVSGNLTVDGGVLLNTVNKNVVWDSSGTFLKLTASVAVTPSISVTGRALWLLKGEASGGLSIRFNLEGEVRFSGRVGAVPGVASSTYHGWIDGDYWYLITGELASLELYRYDSREEDPKDGRLDNVIKKTTLFKF